VTGPGQISPVARTRSAVTQIAPHRIVQEFRAWASVARSAALFILPLPLVLAIVAAAIAGDADRLGLSAGALVSFWAAGVLTWRTLAVEARYSLGDRLDLPAFPTKLLMAPITAGGAALAATAGGQTAAGSLVFALLAAAGYLCFYGLDKRPRYIEVPATDGVDATTVRRQLEEGYQRLRRIEAAARTIAVPEFCRRLEGITAIGTKILEEIERDPRDASRARRFLNLYLDSAERVTRDYARTHREVNDPSLEQNFRQLLVEMETNFGEQHRKLLDHDVVSLDVDIEVLRTRLEREAAPSRLEKP
jgi:5-bromo-4-chloroindolyl phosphate hydrolysis protein